MPLAESKDKSVYWRYVIGELDAADGISEPSVDEIAVLDDLLKKIDSGKFGEVEALRAYLVTSLMYLSGVFQSNTDSKHKYGEVIDLRGTLHNRLNPMDDKKGESAQIEQAFLRTFSILFQIHNNVYERAWTADLDNPDLEAKKNRGGAR